MLPTEIVKVTAADGTEAALVTLPTSKHVKRHRCASCHTPMFASLGPKRVVVPAALFDREALPAE